MTKRPRLTALEIDAILSVAGDADAVATARDCTESEAEFVKLLTAYESGTDKLRAMLASRLRKRLPTSA